MPWLSSKSQAESGHLCSQVHPRSPFSAPAAFVSLCLVWGSTWLAIKVGYGGVDALTGAALRFGLASVVLFLVMLVRGVPLPRGSSTWMLSVSLGLVNFAGLYGLVYWGEQEVDSGLAAVLFAAAPLLTLLVSSVVVGENITVPKAAGILLGIAGLTVIYAGETRLDMSQALPISLIVLAASASAVGLVLVRRWGSNIHPATYTAPAMGIGALLLAGAAQIAGEHLVPPRSWIGWATLLYLALFGSLAAFLVYFWLVRQWNPSHASLVHLISPVVALGLGVALLNEHAGWEMLFGTAMVLGGVGMTTLSFGGTNLSRVRGRRPRGI